ncbi:MAG TPA: hypothetical protein PK743_07485 [Luteimonas sp.]|nr:hypothetical protein [Luteimonas sp.]HRO27189.1 hypothetical protein [Luteimonas sp.]HRP72460.1 hypothetical protein [Luteimonas sp.]
MSLAMVLLSLLSVSGFVFQPPGQFHDDEPVVRHGDDMLALHVDAGGARLARVRIDMRRVPDLMAVDENGPDTGWQVGPEDDVSLLGYLRGEGLVAGEVVQARIEGDPDDMDGGQPAFHVPREVTLVFAGQSHRIESHCEREPAAADAGDVGAQQRLQCHIDLSGPDGTRTRLASMPGYEDLEGRQILGDDGASMLLFAGDLDRDGKLDLLLDVSDHYNVRKPTLFLSGGAPEGAVVRPVASHKAVGC